jgi:putative methionine-R-sulfoxide reductase with GAF domain
LEETRLLAIQLKASREMIAIGSTALSKQGKTSRQVMQQLIHTTAVLLSVEKVHLLEVRDTEFVISQSSDKSAVGVKIPIENGIEAYVLRSQSTLTIPDVSIDSRMNHRVPGVENILLAPIIVNDHVIGVIEAINKRYHKSRGHGQLSSFNSADELVINFVASITELAMSSSDVVMDAIKEKTFESVIRQAYQTLAERVSLFIFNKFNERLTTVVSQDIKGVSIPTDKGIVGACFMNCEVINVKRVREDDRHFKEVDKNFGFASDSILAAPLIFNGVAVGVVQAVNKVGGGHFTKEDETTIKSMCMQLTEILNSKKMDLQTLVDSAAQPSAFCDLCTDLSSGLATYSDVGQLVAEAELHIRSVSGNTYDNMCLYVIDEDNMQKILPPGPQQVTLHQEPTPFLVKQSVLLGNVHDYDLHVHDGDQVGRGPASASDEKNLFFRQNTLEHALIVPLKAEVYPYQHATAVLIIGRYKRSGPPVDISNSRTTMLKFAQFFDSLVCSISQTLSIKALAVSARNNLYLATTATSLMQDTVIMLDSDGRLVATNKKILNDNHPTNSNTPRFGVPVAGKGKGGSKITTPRGSTQSTPRSSRLLNGGAAGGPNGRFFPPGTHYSTFLSKEHCTKLVDHVKSALKGEGGMGFHETSVVFHSNPTMANDTSTDVEYRVVPVPPCNKESVAVIVVISPPHSCTSGWNSRLFRTDDSIQDPNTFRLHTTDLNLTMPGRLQETDTVEPELVDTGRSCKSEGVPQESTSKFITIFTADPLHSVLYYDDLVPEDIFEWEFNVLTIFDGRILCSVIGRLFEALIDLGSVNVCRRTLANYIADVGHFYHNRPFHNFQHSCCVTHFTYCLLQATKEQRQLSWSNANGGAIGDGLSKYQQFGMLLAAVVHDVDHPGHTNLFEVNSGSELALRYNDQAVLENHHCSMAFRLMRKPHLQILENMEKQAATDIRQMVIACIMATDMSKHFVLMDETKQKSADMGFQFEEHRDMLLYGQVLVHAADLSNPVRPYSMSKSWAERISIEFNDQVAREQSLGMPVLGFMMTADEKAFCKNECGFASFVVGPMWRGIANVYPNLNFLVEQLDFNLSSWKKRIEEIDAQEAGSH